MWSASASDQQTFAFAYVCFRFKQTFAFALSKRLLSLQANACFRFKQTFAFALSKTFAYALRKTFAFALSKPLLSL
jgi:hypothetical protein